MSIDSGCTILLIDQRPGYLHGSCQSLLTMPLAGTSLLAIVRDELQRHAPHSPVCIVAAFEMGEDYEQRAHATFPKARLCSPGELFEHLAELEPSDRVLVLDVSHVPLEGLNLSPLASATNGDRTALHLVPLAAKHSVAGERVQLDAHHNVRKIQRYYAGITDVQAAGTIASLLTVSALRTLEDLSRLAPNELRTRLMLRGVPSRDVTLNSSALDLTDIRQLLWLNRRLLGRKKGTLFSRSNPGRNGSTAHQPGRAIIHATARLYGTVFLDDGCEIGPGAVIVGPAVVGKGAYIGAGAVVANAIVHDGVRVQEGAIRTDCVVTGSDIELARTNGRNGHAGAASANGSPVADSDGSDHPAPVKAAASAADSGAKRAMDIILSAIGLVFLSPLMIVTAILVKLCSRGPVLFGHLREGRGGREFRCWKFRTMVANAHEQQRALYKKNHVDGPQFKMDGDPRVTRLGAVLRATNIDELPQLFNVLRGHMSLIGPRPSPFRENQICVPWRKARLSVRPGITGLWQVCRHERSAGDFHQWIHFDMMYVHHWTLAMDLRILAATILTLGGRFSIPARFIVGRAADVAFDYDQSLQHLEQVGLSATAEWMSMRSHDKRQAVQNGEAVKPTMRQSEAEDNFASDETGLDCESLPSASRLAEA